MQRLFIGLLTCYLISSCAQGKATDDNKNTVSKAAQAKPAKEKDTLKHTVVQKREEEIYSFPCAIIVEPTQKKIDSLKKAYGEQDYSILLDDNINYIAAARELFEGKKLKMIERQSIGKVNFKKADGNIAEMEISEFCWGVVLFNGKSDPIEADLTTIEEEYNRYMK